MNGLDHSSRQRASTIAPARGEVYQALVRVLGRDRATVLDFYVDSRLAEIDPRRYDQAVESLLGAHNGRLVTTTVWSELARSGGDRGPLVGREERSEAPTPRQAPARK
jgi:hypothetical protein